MARFAADRTNAERYFTNHRQMLEEVRPDVVHVLTPPHTHYSLVKDCLQANSHVIVEKPMATTLEDADHLIATCSEKGVRVSSKESGVYYQPQTQKARELIEQGVIGEVMGLLTRRRIRHLPVVEKGKMIGLVSIGDVVKAQHDALTMENHYLKEYLMG